MEQRRARGMLAAAAVIFGTLAPFVRGISVSSGRAGALPRGDGGAARRRLSARERAEARAARESARGRATAPLRHGDGRELDLAFFEAYRYTTVSVATLSYYFAPVLVTAACPLLFHEG